MTNAAAIKITKWDRNEWTVTVDGKYVGDLGREKVVDESRKFTRSVHGSGEWIWQFIGNGVPSLLPGEIAHGSTFASAKRQIIAHVEAALA
jgi:hypothetical protein